MEITPEVIGQPSLSYSILFCCALVELPCTDSLR